MVRLRPSSVVLNFNFGINIPVVLRLFDGKRSPILSVNRIYALCDTVQWSCCSTTVKVVHVTDCFALGLHSLPFNSQRRTHRSRPVHNYPGRECCYCKPVRTPCRRVLRTDVGQASDKSTTPVGSVATVSRCALLAVVYHGQTRDRRQASRQLPRCRVRAT